eukprot:TRINITY_DN3964_c0_g2_i1.p1 TRINITY_DN3964_c0_g2~~TRINITY_DN3964_c0_g2_i1.p1  ORF type:complete len:398 (+),score=86.04 TRINITY_DN3964_c0_g2_i1:30-1196(+)
MKNNSLLLVGFVCSILIVFINGEDSYNPKCAFQEGDSYVDLNGLTGRGDYQGDFHSSGFVFQPCREIYSLSDCAGSNACNSESKVNLASLDRFSISKNAGSDTFSYYSTGNTVGSCISSVNVTITCDATASDPIFRPTSSPYDCNQKFSLVWNCFTLSSTWIQRERDADLVIRGNGLSGATVEFEGKGCQILENNPTSISFRILASDTNSSAAESKISVKTNDHDFELNLLVASSSGEVELNPDNFIDYFSRFFMTPFGFNPVDKVTFLFTGGIYQCDGTYLRVSFPNARLIGSYPSFYTTCPIVIDGPGDFYMENFFIQGTTSLQNLVAESFESLPIFGVLLIRNATLVVISSSIFYGGLVSVGTNMKTVNPDAELKITGCPLVSFI